MSHDTASGREVIVQFDLHREPERLICQLMPQVLTLLAVDSQDMKRCADPAGDFVRVMARSKRENRYSVVDFTFNPVGFGLWEFDSYNAAIAAYHQVTEAVTGIHRGL